MSGSTFKTERIADPQHAVFNANIMDEEISGLLLRIGGPANQRPAIASDQPAGIADLTT